MQIRLETFAQNC